MTRSERLAKQGLIDILWNTATVIKSCNEVPNLRYYSTEHCLYCGKEVEADIYEDVTAAEEVYYAVICSPVF